MFRRLPNTDGAPARACHFKFDGQSVEGYAGETVAAALLRADVDAFRLHPVDGSPRLPYCMMGVCQECLVCEEDGTTRRACLLPVVEGLHVSRAGSIEGEL